MSARRPSLLSIALPLVIVAAANGYVDQVGHCEFYDIARLHSFPMEIAHSGSNITSAPTSTSRVRLT